MDVQKIADGGELLPAIEDYAMKHGEKLPADVRNSLAHFSLYLLNEQNEFILAHGRQTEMELACKR